MLFDSSSVFSNLDSSPPLTTSWEATTGRRSWRNEVGRAAFPQLDSFTRLTLVLLLFFPACIFYVSGILGGMFSGFIQTGTSQCSFFVRKLEDESRFDLALELEADLSSSFFRRLQVLAKVFTGSTVSRDGDGPSSSTPSSLSRSLSWATSSSQDSPERTPNRPSGSPLRTSSSLVNE